MTGATLGSLPGFANLGGPDVFLMKLDNDGDEIWTRQFGTDGPDAAGCVAVDSSRNVYVVGAFSGKSNDYLGRLPGQNDSGDSVSFIRKYDSNGNELWTHQFGGTRSDVAEAVVTDESENAYVFGKTFVISTSGEEYPFRVGASIEAYLRKYDSEGNQLWHKQFATEGDVYGYRKVDGDVVAIDIDLDEEGSIYIVGSFRGTFESGTRQKRSDGFVMKLDRNGKQKWTREFGTDHGDFVAGLTVDDFGNIYVNATTIGEFPGEFTNDDFDDNIYVIRYDYDGNEIWTQQYLRGKETTFSADINADSKGNVHIVGLRRGCKLRDAKPSISRCIFLGRYSSDGLNLTLKDIVIEGFIANVQMELDEPGFVYLVGTADAGSDKGSTTDRDAFIMKISLE